MRKSLVLLGLSEEQTPHVFLVSEAASGSCSWTSGWRHRIWWIPAGRLSSVFWTSGVKRSIGSWGDLSVISSVVFPRVKFTKWFCLVSCSGHCCSYGTNRTIGATSGSSIITRWRRRGRNRKAQLQQLKSFLRMKLWWIHSSQTHVLLSAAAQTQIWCSDEWDSFICDE